MPSVADWVLVANAARARGYEREAGNGALREIGAFVHPASRLEGRELGRDRPGHAFKGAASTQYQPHTDPHHKEHLAFARELAAWLEQAALEQRFERLTLCASAGFLGVLRGQLGSATAGRLRTCIARDFTAYTGRELEQRVARAMP